MIGTKQNERSNNRGDVVIGIDKEREKGEYKEREHSFIRSTVQDFLKHSFAGFDAIIHLAATVSVIKTIEDPIGSHDNNATLTLKLLEKVKEMGINKIVFTS